MLDFTKLKNVILENKSFLITTHVNPDADALGSELGFFRLIKQLGKTARIVNYSPTPASLEFLDSDKNIEIFDEAAHALLFNEVDVLVVLDLNSLSRIRTMENYARNSKAVKVVVDHHLDPEEIFDIAYIQIEYSSTGELVYDFIKQTQIGEINYEIALPLYAAIMTDTGSFRYERTTPKTHRIAAEMLELGVDPKWVADEIYDNNQLSRFTLLSFAINSMTLSNNGKICYMIITQEALKASGANESDVEGFVNYTLAIQGVKIGILFYELENGFKVSFRTKHKIPANKIAAEFGGGGHTNASGARLHGEELSSYIEKILDSAEKYYNKFKDEL